MAIRNWMLEALVAKKIGGARSVVAPIEKTRSEKDSHIFDLCRYRHR
jgi:hypothetical protein